MVGSSLVCALLAVAAAVVAEDLQDGLYAQMLNSVNCTFDKSGERDVSMVKLYFYNSETNVNTSHYITNAAAEILDKTDFNFNHGILLWIPGYANTINTTDQDVVRTNLYDYPNSYLIIVDSHYYTNNNESTSYQRSVLYYYDIGRGLAAFLVQLEAGGVNLHNVKVYGHSLGGQIAGALGEAYTNKTGQLLRYIMGVDPAGPCFHKAGKEFQVRSGNAAFVPVIHCNKGVLGTIDDFGDAVFNANGGAEQPGCRTLPVQDADMDSSTASCSHEGCVVIATLPAHQPTLWNTSACGSEENFDSGACANNKVAHLDLAVDPKVRGKYYFSTKGYTNFTST